MARQDNPNARRTEGRQRNAERAQEGRTPIGRPPGDWPKGVPREPVEADPVARHPGEPDYDEDAR